MLRKKARQKVLCQEVITKFLTNCWENWLMKTGILSYGTPSTTLFAK